MIQRPQRGVFRFFLPMVDLMMLMFSMFLLMPIMEQQNATVTDLDLQSRRELVRTASVLRDRVKDYPHLKRKVSKLEVEVKKLRNENRRLRKRVDVTTDLARLKKLVKEWQQKKVEFLRKNLQIQPIHVDAKTGNLLYYQAGAKPYIIDTRRKAADLIERQQRAARKNGRELYYLFLLPTSGSLPINEETLRLRRSWFRDVPAGDNRGL